MPPPFICGRYSADQIIPENFPAYGETGKAGFGSLSRCPFGRRIVSSAPHGGAAFHPGRGLRVIRGKKFSRLIFPEADLNVFQSDQISHRASPEWWHPRRRQDRALNKILIAILVVPVLLILFSIGSIIVYQTGAPGSVSLQELTFDQYDQQQPSEVVRGAVHRWLDQLEGRGAARRIRL